MFVCSCCDEFHHDDNKKTITYDGSNVVLEKLCSACYVEHVGKLCDCYYEHTQDFSIPIVKKKK